FSHSPDYSKMSKTLSMMRCNYGTLTDNPQAQSIIYPSVRLWQLITFGAELFRRLQRFNYSADFRHARLLVPIHSTIYEIAPITVAFCHIVCAKCLYFNSAIRIAVVCYGHLLHHSNRCGLSL